MKNQPATAMVCFSLEQAEEAAEKLQKAGHDLKNLSIVGKDYYTSENIVGYYNPDNRMKKRGVLNALRSTLWGLFYNPAFLIVPGFGPLVIAGPFVSSLVGAPEGAVTAGGLSALGSAFFDLGIPRDSILQYETEIKAGNFVLIFDGTTEEVDRAKETLGSRHRQVLPGYQMNAWLYPMA